MNVREWKVADEEQVKRLFLDYCLATKQAGSWETCVAGWDAQHVTVLVAEHTERLCGFLSLLTIPLAVSPFKAGIPQMMYAEPKTKAAGALLKAGIQWYKRQGVKSLLMYAQTGQEKLWRKHHFHPKLMVMERSL